MRKSHRMQLFAPAFIFALAFMGSIASAQQPRQPYPDEIGVVYLGNSQSLAAIHPRLLTKNAHVAEFVCSPVGTRVAYTTETPVDDGTEETVAVADIDSGEDTVYYTTQNPSSDEMGSLYGWSDDGAYLAFSTSGVAAQPSSTGMQPYVDSLHMVDLVHGTVYPVDLPIDQMMPQAANSETPQLHGAYIWSHAVWAPGERLLAVSPRVEWDGGATSGICLVDPDHKTSRLLFTQEDPIILLGWQDATHIVYQSRRDRMVYDIAAGKSAPASDAHMTIRTSSEDQAQTAVFLPGREALTLSETDAPQTDQGQITGVSTSLWLTRTGGPQKLFKMQLDTFLPNDPNPGNSGVQFVPNGGFDRQGIYRVVYVSEGDLKVVDIMPRRATPGEKLAAGEKLSCEEEIQIATSDARLIGLGIMQYAQDNNLNFPAGGGFHDSVYPYLKDDSVFTSPNGETFQYLAPADPKLADMDVPADTPLGQFDLPCADVVLYGDGHVKVKQKEGAGQAGGSQ